MKFEEDDLPYEEDVLRNAYSLTSWLRYIEVKLKNSSDWSSIYLLYERALKQIPGSYKLWYGYLKVRRENIKNKPINDSEYEEVNNIYDRALAYMNKVFNYSII